MFDTSEDKIASYIAGCKHECRRDAVAIGDIAEYGARSLLLAGDKLEMFVSHIARTLLDFGCKVVVQDADSASEFDWKLASEFAKGSNDEVLESLMKYRRENDDGYGYYAWFAYPVKQNGTPRIMGN